MVDGEDAAPGKNALPPRPRGQKSTKADLAREASAQALSDALAKIMADAQLAQDIREEKRRQDKVAVNAIFLNLTKEVIEVQRADVEAKKVDAEAKRLEVEVRMADAEAKKLEAEARIADVEARMADAEARRLDAEAKLRSEDTRIMLADLSSMDEGTKAWFVKKRAEIQARDA